MSSCASVFVCQMVSAGLLIAVCVLHKADGQILTDYPACYCAVECLSPVDRTVNQHVHVQCRLKEHLTLF